MDGLTNFYKGKTVLVTGHTGFKGSWLTKMLIMMGANVVGFALEPPTDPNLFSLLELNRYIVSIIGDIRDFDKLFNVFLKYQPDIVFHLAAQPIVRDSYKNPKYTYDVNVLGTVNVCECIRLTNCVKSFINITTDKVYKNDDIQNHPFKEDENLDGFDPYSNSKSCSELVTHSYYNCFFKDLNIAVSTVRAGNVIGGGDFAKDRIIPDCFRSIQNHDILRIRNPNSVRPYQHVLEPLYCYLLLAQKQYEDNSYSGAYNVGPNIDDIINTKTLVDTFFSGFDNSKYICENDNGPHEALFLSLDNTKFKKTFDWEPKLHSPEAIKITREWYKCYLKKIAIIETTERQIKDYINNYV